MVQPAEMAPELTTTTRSPAARASATSPLSLSMTAPSTRPEPVVTEEDPTLTTTVRVAAVVREPSAVTTGGVGHRRRR